MRSKSSGFRKAQALRLLQKDGAAGFSAQAVSSTGAQGQIGAVEVNREHLNECQKLWDKDKIKKSDPMETAKHISSSPYRDTHKMVDQVVLQIRPDYKGSQANPKAIKPHKQWAMRHAQKGNKVHSTQVGDKVYLSAWKSKGTIAKSEPQKEMLLHTKHGTYRLKPNGEIASVVRISTKSLNRPAILRKADYMSMYPKERHEEARPFVKWAKQTLPNSNWKEWAIRNHRNDPKQVTPQTKQQLQHFSGMTHVPEIDKMRFTKEHSLEEGLNSLKQAEQKHIESQKSNTHLVPKPATATKIVDVGKDKHGRNVAWYNLNTPESAAEGKAMGHCGNCVGNDDDEDEGGYYEDEGHSEETLHSLRTEHKLGNKVYHEPHLTFVERNGAYGQMKGRGNAKPAPKYHGAITKLLTHTGHSPVGGGYLEENNFHMDDLPEKQAKEVIAKHPHLGIHSKYATPEHVSQALKNKNEDVRRAAISHPKVTPEHISQALKDKKRYVRRAAISHPKATLEHISQALKDEHEDVRHAAIEHPKATSEHISQALKDENQYVRGAAIEHPKATLEHISQALKDKNKGVRAAAIRHPKATSEHVSQALKDKHEDVRGAAISHPKVTPEHISQALKDENEYVRTAAIEHPKVTSEHISQALKDKNGFVRHAAIEHPKVTPEHVSQALKDENEYVRRVAIKHPKATSEHISQALKDKKWYVRRVAIEHPKATSEHISQALKDKHEDVRTAAIEHPKVTSEHISQALKDKNQYVRRAAQKAAEKLGLTKSELKKEMYGVSPNEEAKHKGAHGWISPEGKFHKLRPSQIHGQWIKEKQGLNRDEAHKKGWLVIGSAGEANVWGHAKYLHDPKYPATQTARRLSGDNFAGGGGVELNTIEGDSHLVDTEHWRKHGTIPKSKMALFRSIGEKLQTLRKEMWHKAPGYKEHMRPFHGLISGKGEFHQMKDDEMHTSKMMEHASQQTQGSIKSSSSQYIDMHKDWIKTGLAGRPEIAAHSKTLHDPSHPATKQLADRVKKLPSHVDSIAVHLNDEPDSQPYHVPRKMAEKGNFKKPSKMQMFKSEGETVDLVHYSPKKLTEINPKYHGEGVKGADRGYKGEKDYQPRSYHYTKGTKPEYLVAANTKYKHHSKVEAKHIYDASEDKHGYAKQVREKNQGVFRMPAFETKVKSAGFKGYKVDNVVAMFHPVKPHTVEEHKDRPMKKAEGSSPLPHKYSIITADNPAHKALDKGGNKALESKLKAKGYKYEVVSGKYGGDRAERGFLVHDADPKHINQLGAEHGQDSVIHSEGGKHRMQYTSGKRKGRYHTGEGHELHEKEPKNHYSTIERNGKKTHFTLNFDFGKLHKAIWGHPSKKKLAFHGVISPKGEYQKMDPEEDHSLRMMIGAKTESMGEAFKQGWMTVGGAGRTSIEGHEKHLNNPRHPATKTARKLAFEVHPDKDIELVYHTDKTVSSKTLEPAKIHSVDTTHWAKHGTVPKSKVAQFHKSGTWNIISVDFDDTIANVDFPQIQSLKDGVKEALQRLRDAGYKIVVCSARNNTKISSESGKFLLDMKAFLDQEKVPYDEIDDGKSGKPAADYYIDDKGIRFTDNWKDIANAIIRKGDEFQFKHNPKFHPDYTHMVEAFHEGKKVGHVIVTASADSEGWHNVETGYVHPDHRGRGVYQGLLHTAKELVQSKGSKGIKSEGYQRSKAADRAWKRVHTNKKEEKSKVWVGQKQPSGKTKPVLQDKTETNYFLKEDVTKNDPIQTVMGFDGISAMIEWPRGSVRAYKDGYSKKMKASYGYLEDVMGDDGEELDVYVGTRPESKLVFIVKQMKKKTGKYDEQKVMLHYESKEAALESYKYHMPDQPIGGIEEISWDQLKDMVERKEKNKLQGEEKPDGERHIVRKFMAPDGQSDIYGLISPKGEYHKIGPQESHYTTLKTKYGADHGDGWLTVGHGGGYNIHGLKEILSDPTNPAMETARELFAKYAPKETIDVVSIVTFGNMFNDEYHKAKVEDWVRHGVLINKPSVFSKSIGDKLALLKAKMKPFKKRDLDPNAGYKIKSKKHESGINMTAHDSSGRQVGDTKLTG